MLVKIGLIKYYNFIDTKGNPEISILAPSKNDVIKIPKEFFTYGWDKRLSITAQYCYFINLNEVNYVGTWRKSVSRTLPANYKIGKSALRRGFFELRHWNIMKIYYAPMDGNKNSSVSTFQLIPLYSMQDFNYELDDIISTYGRASVNEAKGFARIVFSENDLDAITDIIGFIDFF